MKFFSAFRLLIASAIISAFANAAVADTGRPVKFGIEDKLVKVFQDTVRTSQRPEGRRQPQPRPQEPSDKSIQDRLRDNERNSIKHVPRSVPKMKPQPVSDGMRVRGNSRN